MKEEVTTDALLLKNLDLENRLAEAMQLIEAIQAGEVDAFALRKNDRSEIFTLQTGDYAYRMLVENFGEGALTLSEDGLIVYTNSYFHDLLDLPYEKVIGQPVFNFISSESRAVFETLFKKGLAGKTKGEIVLVSGNKTIPVYVSLTALSPTLPIVGMIVTDLSEKKMQEKLLEQKNVALEKINKELESFAYIASHDLQEPVRKIQTFASRIAEKESLNLSENGKNMFLRMQQAAARMQTLIEDLLTYSQTNITDSTFEKADLRHLIEEVKLELKDELKAKNAIIEATELCDAEIIPFQFRQMMYNLIGNSLKFATPGKAPHIKIKCQVVKGTQLKFPGLDGAAYYHLSISDNGIGFEPQYSDKVFEVFQRLHGQAEYSGTGIGLAIVKKIVENHNGTISANAELNKGARFDIYIPAREEDPA